MKDELDRVKSKNFAGYLRKPVLKADLIRELSRFLPFEEMVEPENILKPISLTATDREHLSHVLDNLEKLSEQYKAICKNNNISEIKSFTDSLLEVTEKHPISIIQDYAEQLITAIDSFDIATIKHCLNNYPQLISQLEQLKSKNKKI